MRAGGLLVLSLIGLLGCERDKAPPPPTSTSTPASGPKAPTAVTGVAKLSIGQKVTLCWRDRGASAYDPNDRDFTCGASLEAVKGPMSKDSAGVNGKQVFAALRAVPNPPTVGKLWAKSPSAGEDPKGLVAAASLSICAWAIPMPPPMPMPARWARHWATAKAPRRRT